MIANDTIRPRERTLASIKAALEGGGVEFLEEDGLGVGVKFNLGDGQSDVAPPRFVKPSFA